MELRKLVEVMSQEELSEVLPLTMPHFSLLGEPIGIVRAGDQLRIS